MGKTTLYYEHNCDQGLLIDHEFTKKIEFNETADLVLTSDMPNVRSVLLREMSDIALYEQARFVGDEYIQVSNDRTYQEGVDGCVCVNFMKRDGSAYDIGSVRYTQN